MWVTEGIKNAPNAGDLLADSGALAATTLQLTVLVSCDDDSAFVIHQKNMAGADTRTHRVAEFGYFFKLTFGLSVSLNDRITITADAARGNIQASMFW